MPIREMEEKCCCCKEHKALEIIKRKGIDIKVLKWSNNCAEYNSKAKSCIGFTQEEYYLLVEVML